jgi:hypothetical protein
MVCPQDKMYCEWHPMNDIENFVSLQMSKLPLNWCILTLRQIAQLKHLDLGSLIPKENGFLSTLSPNH